MMECPNCEKTFSGAKCPTCGWQQSRAPKIPEAWHTPAWMHQPKPCTAEEHEYASALVIAILEHQITVAQAHEVLHTIFRDRELEL